MSNKKYIRILAEVAIILSAVGMMVGCSKVNNDAVNISRKEIITTDDETTVEETTVEEDNDSSVAESDSSLNESSLNDSSESESKIEQTEIIITEADSNQGYFEFEPEIINETQPQMGAPVIESEPIIVEETVTELNEPVVEDNTDSIVESNDSYAAYSPYDLYNQGRLYYGNYQYTWYSERVLPGYGLAIDGRHTDADGFVCDGDGYICVASSSLNKGAIVDTPFGRQGKVYDTGCDWGVIDVYVNW